MNKKWIHFNITYLILVSALIFVIYLLINIFQAISYRDEYLVDFEKNNFNNSLLPLFINEDSDSPKFKSFGKLNEINYAEINYTPISFTFKPEEFLFKKNITISSQIRSDDNWDLSLCCEDCNKNNQNAWKPFLINSLTKNNYFLIKFIDGYYVYALENKKWKNEDDVYKWIIENLPHNSNVNIMNDEFDISKLSNKNNGFTENSTTEINTLLRGSHAFYAYLGNFISLEITKKDLNKRIGENNIEIKLFDINHKLIFSDLFRDADNTGDDHIQTTKSYSINKDLPKSGLYILELTPIQDDCLIENIKINTNKIIFRDKNYIISDTKLYTENDTENEMEIYSKYQNEIQLTNSNDLNKNIKIDDQDTRKSITIKMPIGENIITAKGEQIIKNQNFSINKESFFKPFIFNLSKTENPDFIITKSKQGTNNNWTDVSLEIDFPKMTKSSSCSILLKNETVNKTYALRKKIFQNKFSPLSSFNNYNIWKNNSKEINTSGFTSFDNILSSYPNSIIINENLSLPENLDKFDLIIEDGSMFKSNIINYIKINVE